MHNSRNHNLTFLGIFFPVALQPDSWSWPPLTRLRHHTHWTHHTREDSYGRVITSTQIPLSDRTQMSQEKNSPAHGWIRTHNQLTVTDHLKRTIFIVQWYAVTSKLSTERGVIKFNINYKGGKNINFSCKLLLWYLTVGRFVRFYTIPNNVNVHYVWYVATYVSLFLPRR
jgi:hypothetical protein